MLKMSLDSSLLDTLVVPWQELRPETPMEGPPAPTSMLTPTVSSRLSTMLLTQSTDSELPAPTSQLDQLSLLLLLLRLQSLTSQSQLPLRIPQRLLLPRLNSRLLLMRPPPLLLREEREAEEVAVAAAPAIAALPYPYAAGLNLAYAGLPVAAPAFLPAAAAVAHSPLVKSVVETPATVETEVAATPVVSYAAAPAIAAPALTYAAAPAIAAPVATPLAAAAPVAVAAAAPSRDAVLTQIKLNPGHATFYRVD